MTTAAVAKHFFTVFDKKTGFDIKTRVINERKPSERSVHNMILQCRYTLWFRRTQIDVRVNTAARVPMHCSRCGSCVTPAKTPTARCSHL